MSTNDVSNTQPVYTVHFVNSPSEPAVLWHDTQWDNAEVAELNYIRPESSQHHPNTCVKLLYTYQALVGIFCVEDYYVRCRHSEYGEPVYKDSCVEFFIKPKPDKGYFNFEFSCGGGFLSSYITDPTRTLQGFKEFVLLPLELGSEVQIAHSMPRLVEPESAGPQTWTLAFSIPFSLFEKYVGPCSVVKGQQWRGNFYKCGDETSHPHWMSWSPVKELNFHFPECFGRICFM